MFCFTILIFIRCALYIFPEFEGKNTKMALVDVILVFLRAFVRIYDVFSSPVYR